MMEIAEQYFSDRLPRPDFSRSRVVPDKQTAWGRPLAHAAKTKLPWLFVLYAVPAVIVLSLIMPPFQVADELAHTERADQISRGKVISDRLGGNVDAGWAVMDHLYEPLWFHPETKQTVALAQEAGAVRWSRTDNLNFQNTAQYGPLLYAPQVIGVLLSRLAGLNLVWTLIVARAINGLVACAIGFLALSICRRARALTFATLLLPMTLSQFASASQDALLISLTILAVAMASRNLTEKRSTSVAEFGLFAFIVTATTIARPPQFALAFLTPAFISRRDPDWKSKALIGAVAIILIVWWMRILSGLTPSMPSNESLSDQSHRLLMQPLLLPTVMFNTFAQSGHWLMKTVVGYLGWTDTLMPNWYYLTVAGALAVALIAPGNRGSILWPATLGLLTVAALITVVSASLYVTWTPLGQATINGLQGRYILGVLPLLGWAIPAYSPRLERAIKPAWYAVLLFPMITMAITPAVIMERYYGTWAVMAGSLRALLLS